ncbi:MAG: ABC transporter permease [Pirellulaceae bacterium]|nr:ABC transporter permease [Pirellulaceae bacterium]
MLPLSRVPADRLMKTSWELLFRAAREHTSVVVLLVLAAALSCLTFGPQHAEGAAAGRELAAELARVLPAGGKVLIVVQETALDAEFAETLARELAKRGLVVLPTVRGGPQQTRQALEAHAASEERFAGIAVTTAASRWSIFEGLGERYPSLAGVKIVAPRETRWPTFLKTSNLLNIANQIAVIAIMAIGMTMVIIAGGIDLSVGSLVAVSAVTTALLIEKIGGGTAAPAWSLVVCGLGSMALCGLIGAASGTLVALVRIPPFIVTLALMSMLRGLAYIQSKGESVHELSPAIQWLGAGGALLSIPNAVLLMLVLYVAADVVMKRTVFGRQLYAVGGNARAARLCGVPVRRVVLATYVISALFAGLGGVLLASQFQSGAPTYGKDYELSVIAAVVVGGTSLSGGQGKMFGTLLGALIIAVVQNGMNLLLLSAPWQQVVLGGVILLAAVIDRLKQARERD